MTWNVYVDDYRVGSVDGFDNVDALREAVQKFGFMSYSNITVKCEKQDQDTITFKAEPPAGTHISDAQKEATAAGIPYFLFNGRIYGTHDMLRYGMFASQALNPATEG